MKFRQLPLWPIRAGLWVGWAIVGWPSLRAADESLRTQIYWMHAPARTPGMWFMNRTRFESGAAIPHDTPPGWVVAAAADFNGDLETDLVWRNPTTGDNALHLMRGSNRVSTIPLTNSPPEFQLVTVADIDGDGSSDLIWSNTTTRETTIWFMERTQRSDRILRLAPLGESAWRLAAAGDLNRDGYADLFWRNQTDGRNTVWLMASTNVLSEVELKSNPDPADKLAAVGYFDGVGNLDLVWRHTNGMVALWMMSGTNFLESVPVRQEPDSNWVIVGTGGNSQPLTPSARIGSNTLEIYWRGNHPPPTTIQARALGSNGWASLSTNLPRRRLIDANVQPGNTYEYKLGDQLLRSAIRARPVEHRGSLVLVVERTVESPLRQELERFHTDLVGDGWKVIRTTAPRHDDATWPRNTNAIASLKRFISAVQRTNGADLKAVILLGHVPIPYSGLHNPDGHAWRSLPADSYYGDIDGRYTDVRVNDPGIVDGIADRRWANAPMDGKWDQESLPPNEARVAELELAVGRIDFANLPAFKPRTEVDLLRQYLEKNHRYRHKLLTFPDRLIVGSYLPPPLPNHLVYLQAVGLGSQLFGATGGGLVDGEPFRPQSAALWGFQAAWGLPYGIRTPTNTYATTTELADPAKQPKLGFIGVYGSYLEDWEYTNGFLRASLATAGSGLGAFWFQPAPPGEGALAFEGLALGAPIGESWRQTVNHSGNIVTKKMFLAYLGDPTLRLQLIAPPSEPTVTTISPGVRVRWRPSTDGTANYLVYRSRDGLDGTWTRLTDTPITSAEFVDTSAPPGGVMFMIRALSLSVTGSGSFTNLSQGVFATRR